MIFNSAISLSIMAVCPEPYELVRVLTTCRVSVRNAVIQAKALQEKNLRSVQQIAEAPLSVVQAAISNPKTARSLHERCITLKDQNLSTGSKRPRTSPQSRTSKRPRTSESTGFSDDQPLTSPAELEASLSLPVETDEGLIRRTTLVTSRGPLLLVFVVELLRYTMPEQPPSSRLSLAKAFANESLGNKATSTGFAKGMRAAEEGWGSGQPTVTIMKRNVIVLKRGGYDWAGNARDQTPRQITATAPLPTSRSEGSQDQLQDQLVPTWSASSPVSIKRSVVIIRTTPITAPGKRQRILQSLFNATPNLTAAKHNVWAYRIRHSDALGAHTVMEAAFDDGHTGCGHALLEAMRKTDTINTLAVMTQWQGGITIGPYLWVMMHSCLEEIRAERLRETGAVTTVGEAVWGLDLEAMRKRSTISAMHAGPASYRAGGIELSVYEPQAVKSYLLRSLAVRVETAGNYDAVEAEDETTHVPEPNVDGTQTLEGEEEQNLAQLTGAIRLLYSSWADHLSKAELDRKAWAWYTSVRPDTPNGSLENGTKGPIKLVDILNLRRKE
ncbi:hypothetical protein GGR52DRAFT_522587 [Hypoxylon sp. FL1284]|nr:hypothetical protein GGR52DRAFT_522587 [Hypoxylon sp. FL1284]